MLNWGNSTLGSPIDGVRDLASSWRRLFGLSLVIVLSATGMLGEFVLVHISIVIQAEFSRLVLTVQFCDLFDIVNEGLVLGRFFMISIGLLVLGLPGVPEGSEDIVVMAGVSILFGISDFTAGCLTFSSVNRTTSDLAWGSWVGIGRLVMTGTVLRSVGMRSGVLWVMRSTISLMMSWLVGGRIGLVERMIGLLSGVSLVVLVRVRGLVS